MHMLSVHSSAPSAGTTNRIRSGIFPRSLAAKMPPRPGHRDGDLAATQRRDVGLLVVAAQDARVPLLDQHGGRRSPVLLGRGLRRHPGGEEREVRGVHDLPEHPDAPPIGRVEQGLEANVTPFVITMRSHPVGRPAARYGSIRW
jgi:hypothetical protein